jgi:hypothetical protein
VLNETLIVCYTPLLPEGDSDQPGDEIKNKFTAEVKMDVCSHAVSIKVFQHPELTPLDDLQPFVANANQDKLVITIKVRTG